MSRPYAEVIGDPIAHSKSPLIHNFWLKTLAIDAEYRARHVLPGELAGYFAQRRQDPDWRGCNVTIPHKQPTAQLVDECDAKASTIGAVNTVARMQDGRLVGTNTDVDGVEDALSGLDLAGRHAVVIGAGGAARAAFALLAGKSAASVRVLARSPEKAMRAAGECGLAAQVAPFVPGSGALEGAALVINATQLGMNGQSPMPDFVLNDLGGMAKDGLVFDMVYAPLETRLLRAARELGLNTSDGLTMLVGQAAKAFERFFGQSPPRDRDAQLRAILTS